MKLKVKAANGLKSEQIILMCAVKGKKFMKAVNPGEVFSVDDHTGMALLGVESYQGILELVSGSDNKEVDHAPENKMAETRTKKAVAEL